MQADNFSPFRKKLTRTIKKWASGANDKRRKLTWRIVNGLADETVPVFIVGAQRSGTSMLGKCLGRSPEIENLGESDPRAFTDYFLRDDSTIVQLLEGSPCNMMIFKPLKDSHRVDELLKFDKHAKAIWAYRNYLDRVNSAVKHFGNHPLDVFAEYKRGQGIAWQLAGLSESDGQLIKRFDIDRLSEFDGAALMWYIRNSLFFNQKLDENERVFLWSYDTFVSNPDVHLEKLTAFLSTRNYPFMTVTIHSRSIGKDAEPMLNPEIEELCASMFERLEAARLRQESRQASNVA